MKEIIKEINLLQVGSESILLGLLDRANLSDRELDDLPFGVNSTFSRFFEIYLIETIDNILYFRCNEVGGCFCEPAYILELNSWPEESGIQEITEILIKLDRPGTTVDNFKTALSSIYYKLNVKKSVVNEFQREELEDRLIQELRVTIQEAIIKAVCDFRNKNSSNLVEKDLERIIIDLKREFN